MATTRSHTSRTAGPVILDLELVAGEIEVLADPDRTHAEVTIATADDEGPSADAVTGAVLDEAGDRIRAHVRDDAGGGSIQVNQFGGRGSHIRVSGSGGVVISSGGSITVNGKTISGGGQHVVVGGSPIRISARVPSGSSIRSVTTSARLAATGDRYDTVTAKSMSGDVDVTRARHLTASTMSGDVEAEQLETGQVSSMSGSVRVSGHVGHLSASTMSGNIRAHADRLDGSSMSGRVVNTMAGQR